MRLLALLLCAFQAFAAVNSRLQCKHFTVSGSYRGHKTGHRGGFTKQKVAPCVSDHTTIHGRAIGTVCCNSAGKGSRPGCVRGNYKRAKSHCKSKGLRLCTAKQLKNGAGEASGCGFDGHLIWSSTLCQGGSHCDGHKGKGGNNLVSTHITVRGNTGALNSFCSGKSTVLSFQKRNIRTNNLGGLGPKTGPGGKVIWWTKVGDVNGRHIDLIMSAIGNAYYNANIRYKRWGRSGKWFAKRFHGCLKPGVGSAGSMKKGHYKFQYKFVWHNNKKPATVHYLPLTFYDLDGGKEYVRTYDAIGLAVAKPTGMRKFGCKKTGSGYFCFADSARREFGTPRNFDRLTAHEKKASVTFLFRNKATFTMIYKTTYDHRVFMFKGSQAIVCKKPVGARRRRTKGYHPAGSHLHRRRGTKRPARRRQRTRVPAHRRRHRSCKVRVTSDPLNQAHRRRATNRKWSVGCR